MSSTNRCHGCGSKTVIYNEKPTQSLLRARSREAIARAEGLNLEEGPWTWPRSCWDSSQSTPFCWAALLSSRSHSTNIQGQTYLPRVQHWGVLFHYFIILFLPQNESSTYHLPILLSAYPCLAKPILLTFGFKWGRVQGASDYVEPIKSGDLDAIALFVT